MTPLVSVIVPTYNRREFLPRCIGSIRAQTYQPVELIIVDDGSTDGTNEILREQVGERLRYISMRHVGLPAIARNVGIEQARGEYIAFCDSDDAWLPLKLEIQLKRMHDNGCNCSCTDAFILGEERTYFAHYEPIYERLTDELLWNNFMITSSVVLHRSLLQTARFNTVVWLRGFEDYALWLSLIPEMKIDFVREPLVYYRRHAASLSHDVKRHDAQTQLRIALTQRVYRSHPLLWGKKLAQCTFHLLA